MDITLSSFSSHHLLSNLDQNIRNLVLPCINSSFGLLLLIRYLFTSNARFIDSIEGWLPIAQVMMEILFEKV